MKERIQNFIRVYAAWVAIAPLSIVGEMLGFSGHYAPYVFIALQIILFILAFLAFFNITLGIPYSKIIQYALYIDWILFFIALVIGLPIIASLMRGI